MAVKNRSQIKSVLVASESPDLYTTKRLIMEAKKLKYQSEWLNPYQSLIAAYITPPLRENFTTLYFQRTTGVRYDDFDLLVAQYHLKNLGHKITNPIEASTLFRSKDKQALFFRENNLKSIQSICYRGFLNEEYWETITRLSGEQKYILKMVRGNQGIGVNLINGIQSLKSILETFNALKDQKFIIQPFIKHKKEWRIFIIKNKIIAIIERKIGDNDFRGNSKHNVGKLIQKISPEIQDEALRGAAQSGLDYCGIDIMEDENEFYFLEFNPVPGFEQIESLSGLNIAKELITTL
ncbi:MAG: ATP-grasp domain-containing protein [Bacteriovorax sp.]|nr:ATP-grasp domain-containing protein [Bacteriovorax sp.]